METCQVKKKINTSKQNNNDNVKKKINKKKNNILFYYRSGSVNVDFCGELEANTETERNEWLAEIFEVVWPLLPKDKEEFWVMYEIICFKKNSKLSLHYDDPTASPYKLYMVYLDQDEGATHKV